MKLDKTRKSTNVSRAAWHDSRTAPISAEENFVETNRGFAKRQTQLGKPRLPQSPVKKR